MPPRLSRDCLKRRTHDFARNAVGGPGKVLKLDCIALDQGAPWEGWAVVS